MFFVIGKLVKLGIIIGMAASLFGHLGDIVTEDDTWRILYYGDPMIKHEICPECDAELSDQSGFNEWDSIWTCEECGTELHHPYLYNEDEDEIVACCPFCDSELSAQIGFDDELPYWICRECDAILVNPDSGFEYAWFCEECSDFLNEQKGFNEDCGNWECTKCGHVNEIDLSEVGSYGNTICNN